MVLVFQLLFSLIITTIYGLSSHIVLDFLGVLSLLGIFLASCIVFLILVLFVYILIIFTTEKLDKKAAYKHFFLIQLSIYVYNFLYRVRIVATGKENLPKNNKFVIYANHIEYTDPIYLKQVFKKYPISYVAKEPLFKTILVRNVLRGIGCVSISKNADRSAMQSILDSIKIVKGGQPMGIFPEGRRTYSNDLTDFKPGAFKLALKAEADIVPVCLYNMHGILNRKGIRKHTAYIHILPIIPYEQYKDLDTIGLSDLVRNQINSQLDVFKANIPQD